MTEIVQFDPATPRRSTLQIERDMDATRERLAGTIAQIEQRVKPANVVRKQRAKVEAKARNFFTADDGEVRWDRVGLAAGGTVAALVGLRMTARSIRWVLGAPRQLGRSGKQQIVYVPVPAPALNSTVTPKAITAA